ncbi:MAG: copper resistance protein NlpE N-terminal domain-containing protein [Chitinophagaceae bacterium]
MKQLTALIILFVFSILSCREQGQKTKTIFVTDTTKVTDTVIFIRDSLAAQAFSDSLPGGFYQGMFPCTGCEGMQEIIFFSPDKKFRLEEQLWGKPAKPKRYEGTWERKEGQIWIYSNGKAFTKFSFASDSLVATERDGRKIPEAELSRYVMKKASAASDNVEWKKKGAEGIEFMAIGTEPFWNLEIDQEKFILFRLADWKKPLIIPIESPVIKKDSTVYTLKAENGSTLRIAIYPQFGSDGMSDYLYDQKVEARYMDQVFRGTGLYLDK